MTTSKKLVSLGLTITTSAWMAGALFLLPVTAGAQSASGTDIQAQINALLAQIQQLQAQLAKAQGTTTSYNYTRDLTVGSKGDDVKALQQVLISGGYLTAVSKPTGYFGPATKAALAKWQKANNVSPAAGYFGPKTRAALAAVSAPTGGAPTGGAPTGGVPTGGAPTGGVTAPATGLAVSLAASNPGPGSMVSGASRQSVLAVNLTAGTAGAVTVSDIKFRKTGVVSDSNISGAYLVENGQVLYQYTSLSSGVIDFPGLALQISAGQTRTIWLQIDLSSSATAGNTISFNLASANDITSADVSGNTITETGSFPVNGNTFTVTSVSNPSLATLTVASSGIGTSVNAGTQAVIVGAWSFTAQQSKVNLQSIKFSVIGSATMADLRNVKLMVNGTQYGNALASVPASGYAFFDLSAKPASLNTGANNVQLYADVMGSPNKNFQFEILNSYDIYALDSQYNVPVAGTSQTGTQVSINTGNITVTADSLTPTGNVAKSQTGVTLAKFDIYAAGESVRVKWLGFTLTFTGISSTSSDGHIKNVYIADDAGLQVGTTISSLETTVTCDTAQVKLSAGTTATNCFGNSSSPISYIVPANTTRVLSLKGDIQSTASFSTITGSLVSGSSNLQGLTSSQTNSSGAATGSALTLASQSLTVAKDSAFGTQTVTKGSTGVRVGRYALTASSAEGVTISNLTVNMASTNVTSNFQNLVVKISGVQFGSTQPTLANSGSYSFSGTAFTVPAGGTVYVGVHADVLSGATAGTDSALTTLNSCSGYGASSLASVSCGATTGQDVVVAGQASITATADTAQPAAGQIVMGSSQQGLASFRFTETSNVEAVKITDLTVVDQVGSTQSASSSYTKAAFSNLALYNPSGSSVGTAGVASASGTTLYSYSFHFATPLLVPQASSITYALKGDAASYSSSGATDNSTHVFKVINSGAATALGNTSNATSAVSISSANGNTMTVQRTALTLSALAIGGGSRTGRSSLDNLGTITFAANSAGAAAINTVTVTFSGTGPSSSTFLDGVTLLDANSTNVVTSLSATVATSSACTGSNTCTKSWNLGNASSGLSVSAGGSYTLTLRIDDTKVFGPVANTTVGLTATVNANTDITYTDALDAAATTGLNLPANVVPLQINAISFPLSG